MPQPSFAPVPAEGRVRPTVPTTPSVPGQRPKPGLRRTPEALTGVGLGTQAPGEGFALTWAEREIDELRCENQHDALDKTSAVALRADRWVSLGPGARIVGDCPITPRSKVALTIVGATP